MRTLIYTAAIVLAIALTLGCEEKSGGKTAEDKQTNEGGGATSIPVGFYKYEYPFGSIQNHYIVLAEKDGKATGLYYGNSDDFDEGREGYDASFFVLPMTDLEINGNAIKFVLNVGEDCFADPIDINITSTKEAVKAGYSNNSCNRITDQRQYVGLIQADGIIFFKQENDFLYDDRKFTKVTKQAIEETMKAAAKAEAEASAAAAAAAAKAQAEQDKAQKEADKYLKAAREKALKEERTFTDSRDGKTYMWVKIGEQVWMAENLNFETKEDEDRSWCYSVSENKCLTYGRLYTSLESAVKACPSGWHLPSKAEWQTLLGFAGGEKVAGKKLKAKSGWIDSEGKSGNGTDDYGFAALPGGYCFYGLGDIDFSSAGDGGYWRSVGAIWSMRNSENSVVENDVDTPSVRCIKD